MLFDSEKNSSLRNLSVLGVVLALPLTVVWLGIPVLIVVSATLAIPAIPAYCAVLIKPQLVQKSPNLRQYLNIAFCGCAALDIILALILVNIGAFRRLH
jgi:hypothetical protein